jgi:hypothetical protein
LSSPGEFFGVLLNSFTAERVYLVESHRPYLNSGWVSSGECRIMRSLIDVLGSDSEDVVKRSPVRPTNEDNIARIAQGPCATFKCVAYSRSSDQVLWNQWNNRFEL